MVHGRFEAARGSPVRLGDRGLVPGRAAEHARRGRRTSPSGSSARRATTRSRTSPRCGRTSARRGALPRRLPPRARRARGAVVLPAAARVARAPRPAVRGRPADRRARGRAGRVDRDLRRLRAHPPLVQRARLRPPRRRQDPLLARPSLRPPARVDRVLPHLGLGRDAGGDVRLAAAVDRRRREPLQPARDLLLDARGLVGVGAARDRLAPAVLAPLRAVRPRRRPAVLGADVGGPRVRGRRAASRPRPPAPRCGSTGSGEAGRRAEALYLDVVGRMRWFEPRAGRAQPARARLRRARRRHASRAAAVRDGELRTAARPTPRRAARAAPCSRRATARAPGRVRRRGRDADRGRAAAGARGRERRDAAVAELRGAVRRGRRAGTWTTPDALGDGARGRAAPGRRRRCRRCCGPTATRGSCSSRPSIPRATVVEIAGRGRRAAPVGARRRATASIRPAHAARWTSSSRACPATLRVVGAVLGRAGAASSAEPVEGGVRVRLDFARRAVRAARVGGRRRRRRRGRAPSAREPSARRRRGRSRSRRRSRTTGATSRRRRARRRDVGARARGRAAEWAPGARDVRAARALGRAGGRGRAPAPGGDAGWKRPSGRRRAASTRTRCTSSSSAPSGRVPEEFLDFGPVAAGEAVHLRARDHAERRASRTHLAVGARGGEARLARRPAGRARRRAATWRAAPVELAAGRVGARPPADARRRTSARCARTSRSSPTSRATRAPSGCAPPAAVAKSSVVAFSTRISLPADADRAEVLVGANGPCRVLVDGVEVGRQGGFDPYAEMRRDRLQPYDLARAPARGRARAAARAARRSAARGPAALLDGLVQHRGRNRRGCARARAGRCRRDGAEAALDIRLDQRGDPAYNHAWQAAAPASGGRLARAGRARPPARR